MTDNRQNGQENRYNSNQRQANIRSIDQRPNNNNWRSQTQQNNHNWRTPQTQNGKQGTEFNTRNRQPASPNFVGQDEPQRAIHYT